MRTLLILFASTFCLSCEDGQHTSRKPENGLTAERKEIKETKDILDEVKSDLTKDRFVWEIDNVYDDSLSFKHYNDVIEQIDSVKLRPNRLTTIKAKALTPLKGTDLYPRLVFQEAYFEDKIVSDSLIDRIEVIINNQDMINDKTYDMIIKGDNQHLIYISTDAKAFEKYVKRYGTTLKIRTSTQDSDM